MTLQELKQLVAEQLEDPDRAPLLDFIGVLEDNKRPKDSLREKGKTRAEIFQPLLKKGLISQEEYEEYTRVARS